jgi:predicted Zn-dependent protease
LYRAQGDESEARAAANRANRRFRELVEDEPGKPALRLLHARGLVFLKDYQAAFEVLYEGYAEYGQDPDLRKAVGEVLVLYARSLESEPQTLETIRKRLRTLEQALKFAPDNPVVMRSITDTVLAAAESEDAEIAQLREALIDGASPGMAHFIRGTIAMMQDRPQEAAVELQLASKEMPQSSTVLNNLAVARTKLAAKRDNDMGLLEEALRLIDKAIDLVADAPTSRMQRAYFRETRGQVLLAMGKHLEAIPEFEAALAVDALEEQANRSIAKCYEALDLPERAAEHRREAERLAAANAQAGEDASEQGVGDSTDTSQAADGQQPLESSDQP